jgi:hypothetical protein
MVLRGNRDCDRAVPKAVYPNLLGHNHASSQIEALAGTKKGNGQNYCNTNYVTQLDAADYICPWRRSACIILRD